MKTKHLAAWSLLLMLTSCGGGEKTTEKVPVIKVRTETVGESSFGTGREYVGVVEEESATMVSFTGSGTITRMCVSAGDKVKKGQLIAEMDRTQAQNMLAAAQAMMTQAKDAEARMKQLHDNHSLPDMEWVETQSKVGQAQAQLDMARKSLADCSVYAPVSGVIGKDVSSVGETALPAMPVAKILDIRTVKVKASIPEKEIAAISRTTPVSITVEALGNRIFNGGSIEKGIEGSSITHTYDIKVSVANPDTELLPGMVCKVSFGGSTKNVMLLTAPITSVHKNARGEQFVWVVKDGKALRRKVTVGNAVGNRIAITQGLSEGDVIVTEGHQKLSEGSQVTVKG